MLELNPKFIDTGSGNEIVILTRAEYDSLLSLASKADEDAEDNAIFSERMAELRSDPNQVLPPEVSRMILRGDRLLTALRNLRDVTQMQLAFKTGLSQGYISDIEAGRRTGTPETMAKIAAALDVDPKWLIS